MPRLEEKSNTYSLGWDALAGYAQDGGPCQYNISTVAEQLFAEIEINKMTKLEATNFVLNFVRSIPYAEDPHDKDYPKYPYETILDLEGDCEDHAILFAAIMSLYGQDVILVRTINHLVPAVNMDLYMEKPPFVGNRAPSYVQFHGKTYYICEATSNETIREIWFQVNCGYNYPSDKKNKDSGTKSKDTKFEFIYPDLEPIYGAAKVEKNEKFVLKDIY
ncbi:MAG: hypothetical protein KDD52_06460 [Bdellovibrionales bacterium]|nr:hypothetical protein [Bdellovibrionales bacterium]